MADEIIEELWKIREDFARKHDYDIHRMFEYLRSIEGKTAQDWLAEIEARADEEPAKEEPEDPGYDWDEFMQEYGKIKAAFTTERGFDSKGMMDYFQSISLQGMTVPEWLAERRAKRDGEAQAPREKAAAP